MTDGCSATTKFLRYYWLLISNSQLWPYYSNIIQQFLYRKKEIIRKNQLIKTFSNTNQQFFRAVLLQLFWLCRFESNGKLAE